VREIRILRQKLISSLPSPGGQRRPFPFVIRNANVKVLVIGGGSDRKDALPFQSIAGPLKGEDVHFLEALIRLREFRIRKKPAVLLTGSDRYSEHKLRRQWIQRR
jgi:hypothetical protein